MLPGSKGETKFTLEAKIKQIYDHKKEAFQQIKKAKTSLKIVLDDIKKSGGEFDSMLVENTVTDLINYVTENEDAVSYLFREILSFDEYLYNHSINVCVIATAVMKRFSEHFEKTNIDFMADANDEMSKKAKGSLEKSLNNPLPQEHREMSIGCYLHDIGKILVNETILNKKGVLTKEEFDHVKTHSYEKGLNIIQRNSLNSPIIENIVAYHHAPLFHGEENCYPSDRLFSEIPVYTKTCKLADIYDAMSSKRCYDEAQNPSDVISAIFSRYVNKDKDLQLLIHCLINVIGICPPGSIVFLSNRQLGYVLDSHGPIIIPFTDTDGNTMTVSPDPIDFGEKSISQKLIIDKQAPTLLPKEVYNKLPAFLRELVQ